MDIGKRRKSRLQYSSTYSPSIPFCYRHFLCLVFQQWCLYLTKASSHHSHLCYLPLCWTLAPIPAHCAVYRLVIFIGYMRLHLQCHKYENRLGNFATEISQRISHYPPCGSLHPTLQRLQKTKNHNNSPRVQRNSVSPCCDE